jgi:hypothetical protein
MDFYDVAVTENAEKKFKSINQMDLNCQGISRIQVFSESRSSIAKAKLCIILFSSTI